MRPHSGSWPREGDPVSLDAWREIALGEEAAVYAYGVLAAQLAEPEKGRAIDAGIAHARARGRAREELSSEDADPPAPAAFRIPYPLDGPTAARRLAVLVESRLVEVYCRQTPLLTEGARTYAAETAQECARRAVSWGGDIAAFPGGSSAAANLRPEVSSQAPTPAAPTTSAPAPDDVAPASPTPQPATPSTPPAGSDGAVVQ